MFKEVLWDKSHRSGPNQTIEYLISWNPGVIDIPSESRIIS